MFATACRTRGVLHQPKLSVLFLVIAKSADERAAARVGGREGGGGGREGGRRALPVGCSPQQATRQLARQQREEAADRRADAHGTV